MNDTGQRLDGAGLLSYQVQYRSLKHEGHALQRPGVDEIACNCG